MGRSTVRLLPLSLCLVLPILGAQVIPGCSSSETATSTTTTSSSSAAGSSGAGGAGGAKGTGGSSGTGGMAPDPTAICAQQKLSARPWAKGPYGTHRDDVAGDFSVPLDDGSTWSLKEHFSGCESYVFIPDVLEVSQDNPTSIWSAQADLQSLISGSPKNVHYFFVSEASTDAAAQTSLSAQSARVKKAIAKLPGSVRAAWRDHLHVVAKRAADLDGWLPGVFATHGQIGFAVDRLQKIRGAGDLADVTRIDQAAQNAGMWPFEQNLAYAAHYPSYYNAESDIQDKLDAEQATVVPLWKGDILSELADATVTLPSAAQMAGFDTLEVEVTQLCPNPDAIEIGNCGAWDYIASLFIDDDPKHQVEIARFITSYHRETHWVVDISEMLPLLQSGGQHTFEWSFAPSWNVQPTATFLSLRLSSKAKGMHPTAATFLYAGGGFGSTYNVGRTPTQVPIPATAKKVELFVIVTGHGSGTNQCSEFCNHEHEFTVNGTKHLDQFPEAGTEDQCIPNLAGGMTPNQAGTWWYGRGGWCPGMQVNPWVVDVTSEVTPGQTATVSYRGLFDDTDPPPDGSGNIVLTSYLVVWE